MKAQVACNKAVGGIGAIIEFGKRQLQSLRFAEQKLYTGGKEVERHFGERPKCLLDAWHLWWLREEKNCHRNLEGISQGFELGVRRCDDSIFPFLNFGKSSGRLFEAEASSFARPSNQGGSDWQPFAHSFNESYYVAESIKGY